MKKTIFLIFLIWIFTIPVDAQMVTVTDQLGRKVSVPANPKRVISLTPSTTEIIFDLKKEKLLKGATIFSDYPEAAKKLPRVGSYIRLDLEKIIALKPDLCIAMKDGNPKESVLRLERMGIPVYAVDPRELYSVMETVTVLGKILNAVDQANKIVTNMSSRINKVRSLVNKTKHRPKVFFQIGIAPIVSVGTNTFINELIEFAGGDNLAKGDTPYPRFSKEQVLKLAPEIFIITSMARYEIFNQVKKEWSEWKNLPAVQNNKIFVVDSNILDRATPRMVKGLELLSGLIHPEIFKNFHKIKE